ncbi:MAG TPA: carbohydrate ABC transporter permease [Vicinamibacterales bacterium]|nr:carbohydrate ABC transporter permease [Vicinamibacterales bacterium]
MKRRWLISVALVVITVAFLLPQLWLVSLSLKDRGAVFAYPPQWIPDNPSLFNYVFALTGTQVPWYLWNSVKVAVLATVLTLAAGIPAGFILSRERFPGRGPLLALLLTVQMLSPVVLLLPLYGLIETLSLIDSHVGLVLTYTAIQVPFTAWVLKNFFDAVPPALFEAARLDGASRLRTLRSIALPLVAPGLAATTIFNLAAYWSEFALALVLLDSQSRFTIPLGVFSLQSAYDSEWQLVAAASFIGLVPMMAAFLLLQRYFIAGLTAGAVKG